MCDDFFKHRTVGMMLKHIEHNHDQKIRERLDRIGIQKSFGPLLMEIYHRPGITQTELADRMHFSAPTISVTLQKMSDLGYAERKTNSGDQRLIQLYLTEMGEKTATEMHNIFTELDKEVTLPLNEDECKTLQKLLEKMCDYIDNGRK
jgi:DNA-binding MarR family transcriptional regulator